MSNEASEVIHSLAKLLFGPNPVYQDSAVTACLKVMSLIDFLTSSRHGHIINHR